MRVNFKEGVYVLFLDSRVYMGLFTVSAVYGEEGVTPVVTSACDSHHSPGSLHPKGLAFDLRIWGLKDPWKTAAALIVKLKIVSPCWQVVFGDPLHLDHIHIEFDERGV